MSPDLSDLSENYNLKINYSSRTHVGLCREENQDSYAIIENQFFKIFVIADGMGGVKGGKVASELAVQTIKNFFQIKKSLSKELIVESIQIANKEIKRFSCQDATLNGMGTTLTLLGIQGKRFFIANVGDSRIYRDIEGDLKQVTEDHTFLKQAIKEGVLVSNSNEFSCFSHLLTRCLGTENFIEVDCWEHSLEDCYAESGMDSSRNINLKFLLCSDGLHGIISDEDIGSVLKNKEPESASIELIDKANDSGGLDNITVICVYISNFRSRINDYEVTKNKKLNDTTSLTSAISLETVLINSINQDSPKVFSGSTAKSMNFNNFQQSQTFHFKDLFVSFFVFSGMIAMWVIFLYK